MTTPDTASPSRLRGTLAVLVSMHVLAFLNEAFVTTAAPRAAADFHGFGHITWIFTAYAVAMTVSLPLIGRMADSLGVRAISAVGAACFTTGSLLCSVSWSLSSLAVFRGIQGIGGAALMSMSMLAVGMVFPRDRQAQTQGTLLASANVALAGGPLLGGFFTDLLSWRWCFYLSVVFGVAMFALAFTLPPPAADRPRGRIDYLGAITFIVCALALLFALSSVGDEAGLSRQSLTFFGLAAVTLGALIAIERRVPQPLFPLKLFARREILLVLLLVFVSATSAYIVTVYYPIFTQVLGGSTATRSGLLMLPFQVGLIGTNLAAGALATRLSLGRQIALGFALVATAFAGFAWFASPTGGWITLGALVTAGAGLGIAMPLFMVAVHRAVPREQMGAGTTSVGLFRRLGSSIGIAVLGAMLAISFQHELAHKLSSTTMDVLAEHSALHNPQALVAGKSTTLAARLGKNEHEVVLRAARESLSRAIRTLFGATAALALIATGLALLIDDRTLRPPAPPIA